MGAVVPKLLIQEVDGTPSGRPGTLKVSNGTLTDNGDGSFSLTTGGGGSPGGSNTQVQFNDSSAFGGSANLTWVSPALTIGAAGATTGILKLTGSNSGTISISGASTAGTWTMTLPTSGGTNNYVLSTNGSGVTTWVAQGAGAGVMTYTDVSGTTQTIASNNAYGADNEALVTFTLPSSPSIGDLMEIDGVGAGGWKIAQNASQQIVMGGNATTAGTGGYLASTHKYDVVFLRYTTTNKFNITSVVGSPSFN